MSKTSNFSIDDGEILIMRDKVNAAKIIGSTIKVWLNNDTPYEFNYENREKAKEDFAKFKKYLNEEEEMNYEQRYKEALKAVKELQEANPSDDGIQNWVNENFHELAKSEDERMVKEIMCCVESCYIDEHAQTIRAWLEKKVEQKSFDYENATIVPKDFAPKEEPKFHEGNWVVYNNDICQIVKREEGCNKLVTVFGIGKELVNERNLSTARLWTIQDAKDGDVLFAENFDNIGGCVFLFKGLDSWKFDAEGDKAVATGYCCASITESGSTDFGIQGPDCVEIKRVHPATKEQRDLLFYKMKESGYEWDAEKKELKLLITNGGDFCESENCEQKPADKPELKFHEGDSALSNVAEITYTITVTEEETNIMEKLIDNRC